MKTKLFALILVLTTSPLAQAETVAAPQVSDKVPLTSLLPVQPAQFEEGLLIGPAANIRKQNFRLMDGRASAELNVEYRGEPLARPTYVSIDTHCVRTDGRWQRLNVKRYHVCEFRGLSYDKQKNRLTVKLRTSDMVDGITKCVHDRQVYIPIQCARK